MKHILFLLIIGTGSIANAQKLTAADIIGAYEVSKLYLNDTLYYDKYSPQKSNKNVLLEIGKQVPSFVNVEDSTLALELFYKDIKKALGTTIYFYSDSTTEAICNLGFDMNDGWRRNTILNYTEKWNFNANKQTINILRNGKITERIPAKRINNVITLFIGVKIEKTKIELVKIY